MFIKPYRNLLLNDPVKSHAEWLRKDMELAPKKLLQSFTSHVESIESDTIQYHLAPVFKQVISGKKPADVSLQFSGSSVFILRDLAFGETIVKSIMAKINKPNINDAVDVFFEKINSIYLFLHEIDNRSFGRAYMNYHKSFVLGFKADALSINDIEYVDVFLDTKHDAIPTTKQLSLCPEVVNRVGVSLRFYLNQREASFRNINETVNCSSTGYGSKYNTIADDSKSFNMTYALDSQEYYFEMDINDIDGAIIKYIEAHKELLSKRLGYVPNVIDRDILKVVDMIVI